MLHSQQVPDLSENSPTRNSPRGTSADADAYEERLADRPDGLSSISDIAAGAAIYAPLRSVLNARHWRAAPLILTGNRLREFPVRVRAAYAAARGISTARERQKIIYIYATQTVCGTKCCAGTTDRASFSLSLPEKPCVGPLGKISVLPPAVFRSPLILFPGKPASAIRGRFSPCPRRCLPLPSHSLPRKTRFGHSGKIPSLPPPLSSAALSSSFPANLLPDIGPARMKFPVDKQFPISYTKKAASRIDAAEYLLEIPVNTSFIYYIWRDSSAG